MMAHVRYFKRQLRYHPGIVSIHYTDRATPQVIQILIPEKTVYRRTA